jgi:hypothetical protein
MPDDESFMGVPEVLHSVSPEIIEVHTVLVPPRAAPR